MSCCASSDVRTTGHQEAAGLLVSGRVARWRFIAVAAVVFIASSAATIAWCGSPVTTCGCGLDAATGCPLATSMWRPGPGQGWSGVAAEFLGMWSVMMTAMMLPSLAPRLWGIRQKIAAGNIGDQEFRTHPDRQVTTLALGYLAVWILTGVVVFPVGATLAVLVRDMPTLAAVVPFTVGVIVVLAGMLQATTWKARQLTACRAAFAGDRLTVVNQRTAWRRGLRLGLHCVCSCAPLTVVVLAIGMMDLWVMALVTAAITLERLMSNGIRIARVIGAVAVIAGLVMLLQAIA